MKTEAYGPHVDVLLRYTQRHLGQTIVYADYRAALLREFPRSTNDHVNASIRQMVDSEAIRKLPGGPGKGGHGKFRPVTEFFKPPKPPTTTTKETVVLTHPIEEPKVTTTKTKGRAFTSEERELMAMFLKESPRTAKELAEFMEIPGWKASNYLVSIARKGLVTSEPRATLNGGRYFIYTWAGEQQPVAVKEEVKPEPEPVKVPAKDHGPIENKHLVYSILFTVPVTKANTEEVLKWLGEHGEVKVIDVNLETKG